MPQSLRSPDATVVGPLTFFAPSACQYRMVPSNATVIWVPSGAITPPKLAVPDASLKRPVPPVNAQVPPMVVGELVGTPFDLHES